MLAGQEGIKLVLSASVFQMSGLPSAKTPRPWLAPKHVWEFLFGNLLLESSLGFVIEYLRPILPSPCLSFLVKWQNGTNQCTRLLQGQWDITKQMKILVIASFFFITVNSLRAKSMSYKSLYPSALKDYLVYSVTYYVYGE